MKFICSGCRSLETDSIRSAGERFAMRFARRRFGRNADVRTCSINSQTENGQSAEFSAFIGITSGNTTTGHNINFTIHTP